MFPIDSIDKFRMCTRLDCGLTEFTEPTRAWSGKSLTQDHVLFVELLNNAAYHISNNNGLFMFFSLCITNYIQLENALFKK